MSSGFVSAGTVSSEPLAPDQTSSTSDAHADDHAASSLESKANPQSGDNVVDSWAAADAAIKAAREKAASSSLVGSQEGGKTLFDVLQANKGTRSPVFP